MEPDHQSLMSALMNLSRTDFDFMEDLVSHKERAQFIQHHQRRVTLLSPCAAQRHDRLQAAPESVERAVRILGKFGL